MSKAIEIYKQIKHFNREIDIDLLDCELWEDKIIFVLKFDFVNHNHSLVHKLRNMTPMLILFFLTQAFRHHFNNRMLVQYEAWHLIVEPNYQKSSLYVIIFEKPEFRMVIDLTNPKTYQSQIDELIKL